MDFYSPIDSSPSTKPLLLAMTRRTQGSMQLHGLFCGTLSTLMSLHYNDSVYYPPPHPSPSSIINTRCARRLLFIVGSSWRSQLSLKEIGTIKRLRCILWVITLHSTISYYKMRFDTRKTELEASTCQFPRKLRS